MANKAFEIQNSSLRVGGVELQAGTTGVVIPGVTQATNYFVEEVDDRDGNNPNTFGNDAEAVKLIDNAAYLFRSGAQQSSGSYSEAGYSVDELEDGEIHEINVEVDGVFTSADKAFAEAGNMWASTVSDAKTKPVFDTNDWTQIPFRPKIRAGEVESIGGGGASALEELDDVQLDGPSNGQVLTWNSSQEKWENQDPSGGSADLGSFTINSNIIDVANGTDIYIETSEDGGDGESRLILKPDDDVGGSNPTRLEGSYGVGIWANTTGTAKKWLFGNNGNLKLPAGGDIVDSTGASVLGGGGSGSTTKSWTTPNSTTWTIEEYSGGWAGGFNHPIAEITYTMVEDMSFGDNFIIDVEANPEVWTAIQNSTEFVINGVTTTSSGYGVTSYPNYRVSLNDQVAYVTGDTMTIRYRNTNANPEPEVWWDADNSASGNNNFRGAIIEYHALCNSGTVIGKIFIAADDENAVTHMESMSGSSSLAEYEFWYAPEYGQLAVRRVGSDATNDDTQVWVQWTSKIFYSSEYDC
jgi:hypothetical protein